MNNRNNNRENIEPIYSGPVEVNTNARRLKRVAAILAITFAGISVFGVNSALENVGSHATIAAHSVDGSERSIGAGMGGLVLSGLFYLINAKEEKRSQQIIDNQ